MSTPSQIVGRHHDARVATVDRVTRAVIGMWRMVDVDALDAVWDFAAPSMVAAVAAAQVEAAQQAERYMRAVDRYQRNEVDAQLAVESFAGVTLAGREVGPEMYSAVTQTKTLIGRGVPRQDAFQAGAAYLATLVGAMVQDIGRQADMTIATAKGYSRYVRVVSPGACSRCAILAGRDDYRKPFLRHPRCRCQMWPVEGTAANRQGPIPEDLASSPGEYFDSLSPAEQNRVFTKAGADAIRAGADPIQVVNARRGYFGSTPPSVPMRRLRPIQIGVRPDGTPLTVYATSEGTTVRGVFGRRERAAGADAIREGRYRRTTTVRLMPEQIVRMAGNDPERLRELLYRYGYLWQPPTVR
ncbi:hypothetical protein [Microcella sp.]|uniref:hypothetical protein n=1 Tax=Microcella sp. TaxID=1913979 RepID=UPI00391BA4DC